MAGVPGKAIGVTMLFTVTSVFFFVCLLAGWGGLCVRYLRFETDNPWLYPFLGMFAAGTLFTAVSLYWPLNGMALAVFILVGLVGLPGWARTFRKWHSAYSLEARAVFWAIVFGATVVLAARCAYTEWPGFAYDTDLYHANTVRWLNEYGTPPGLASLHGRLGMNSIWLVLSALFDNVYWDNRIAWVMGVLPFLCTIAYLSYNILFTTGKATRLFCGVMLFFAFTNVIRFPNLYYDLPALWINMMVFTECLARAENGWRMTPGQASALISLAALAFIIKPMTGITLFFVTAAALYGLRKNHYLAIGHACRAFAPAVTAGIVWMTRNALLSGYPLFPLSLFPLPMDWTLPKEQVIAVYEDIIAWARMPGPGYRQSLHTWDWVVPWLERHIGSRRFWRYAGLPLLMALPLWSKALCRRKNATPIFFAIWATSSLFYWFFTAPDLRFGAVFFQIFFALGLAFALYQAAWPASWKAYCAAFLQNRRSYIFAPTLALLIVLSTSVDVFYNSKRSLFYIKGIPAKILSSRELDTSVTPPILLFFPINGNDRCGNSPIPCTPYDNPNLRLRVPGDLGSGFHIE
jgi:hypothetical protein